MSYPHYIIDVARQLRKSPTPAEKVLWEKLRNRKLGGLKFVRQHPFGRYVADFYCAELKFIIELEGSVHEDTLQKEYDDQRLEELKIRGMTVLRFKNHEILNNAEKVLKKIMGMKSL